MDCKKCGAPKTVTLRQKDHYCDQCFMTGTNHKFRACLGKNKVLSPNERVLIGLSGGPASTVLLDLVHYGLSLDNNKKLRIVPHFIHLYDDKEQNCATVLDQCKKYNSQCYFSHISNFMRIDIELPELNSIQQKDENISKQFKEMLSSLSATAGEDFMAKVKRHLFIKYARKLNCGVVFTAEITNTLAMNLLSNIVLGRGSQVQNDVGFSDTRDETVKILKPMRDISKEELDYYYINISKLEPISYEVERPHNLQSTIRHFVEDLQENFQSTISTVCKTADKIGIQEENNNLKCEVCKSAIKAKDFKLSALEATNFSRTVSFGQSKQKISKSHVNDDDLSMFPHIHKHLCYTCSRNYLETDKTKLPQHIRNILS